MRPLSTVLLLPLVSGAQGASPLDLPAEARFGLLTQAADGDMRRARMTVRALVLPPASLGVRASLRRSEERSARAPPGDMIAAG
jgi:hypothetical protein